MSEYNKFDNSNNESASYSYQYPRNVNEMRQSYEKELNGGMELGQSAIHQVRKKKRGASATTLMASFLVGALVVGGSMYMADRYNVFTGATALTAKTSATANGSSGAGLTTASYNGANDAASVYKNASPAVVKIENYAEAKTGASITDDPWFQQFFGGMQGQQRRGGQAPQSGQEGQQQQQKAELQLSGTGTGFVFDASGYILTNHHVIADAKELKVTVQGYDEPLTAKVVVERDDLDLAVLKVENPNGAKFNALSLGDSDDLNIGDWVIAIGNPYGLDQTMTMGILSAKERPITVEGEDGQHELTNLLQTDASINPGNSGGPLLNEQGEVIGINTAINSEAQGIGFAIPTSTIQKVIDQMKSSAL